MRRLRTSSRQICKSRKGFGFGREECRLPLERKTGRRENSLRNQRRQVLRLQKPWKNLPWTSVLWGKPMAGEFEVILFNENPGYWICKNGKNSAHKFCGVQRRKMVVALLSGHNELAVVFYFHNFSFITNIAIAISKTMATTNEVAFWSDCPAAEFIKTSQAAPTPQKNGKIIKMLRVM